MNGSLTIVGLGPGSEEMMSGAAVKSIEDAQVVVGYNKYLDLASDLIENKETFGTGMRREMERLEKALSLADEGRKVVLISSGDPGIYGMAGPALEMISERGLEDRIEINILPGITAAVSCASLLGAPLMHDFAVISLSDLLTDGDLILKRLRLAAEGDFVTVLYNPKSIKRKILLVKAREIFLSMREETTPVGIVKGAYREDEKIQLTDLGSLPDFYPRIDMSTTVIIGNSGTRVLKGRMVTPRGYEKAER